MTSDADRPAVLSHDKDRRVSHVVLLAVALAFPMLKVAWTLGGSGAAEEVFLTMGIKSWPDVLTGMLLTDALLASVVAVVVCRLIPTRSLGRTAPDRGTAGWLTALALIAPPAFGVIVGAVHGPAWGVAVTLTAYALRWGSAVSRGDGATGWRGKAAVATAALSLLLASALPLVALADCFDGHAWAPVLACDIDTGEGKRRGRVVELARTGPGVVGWDLDGREAVNGVNCAASDDQQVRAPWWRD
ncbi:hypothetical protein [Streptomyces qinglanensis]|uniref:hypothetical protein n=1 Tax=Streptomyces qinglanensis TaxID=943816 RepID=UPI003D74C212